MWMILRCLVAVAFDIPIVDYRLSVASPEKACRLTVTRQLPECIVCVLRVLSQLSPDAQHSLFF
jgi:hypothetical protein